MDENKKREKENDKWTDGKKGSFIFFPSKMDERDRVDIQRKDREQRDSENDEEKNRFVRKDFLFPPMWWILNFLEEFIPLNNDPPWTEMPVSIVELTYL